MKCSKLPVLELPLQVSWSTMYQETKPLHMMRSSSVTSLCGPNIYQKHWWIMTIYLLCISINLLWNLMTITALYSCWQLKKKILCVQYKIQIKSPKLFLMCHLLCKMCRSTLIYSPLYTYYTLYSVYEHYLHNLHLLCIISVFSLSFLVCQLFWNQSCKLCVSSSLKCKCPQIIV